jgi:hypothetical protein
MVGGVIADPSLALWTGSHPHSRTGHETLRQAQGKFRRHPERLPGAVVPRVGIRAGPVG